MTRVDEIEANIFRISTATDVMPGGFTFNQYLIVDESPLLFHTGPRRMFPLVREALARVIDPTTLRYVGFSHYESDECGALNDWLAVAPDAVPVCSQIGAMVSVNDMADRPPRPLGDGEVLVLGKKRLRWLDTPHLPHGMDCGYLFEESTHTLLCGDLFSQPGADMAALTTGDIFGPSEALRVGFAPGFAYERSSGKHLAKLAATEPRTLACMHGSAWRGDGAALLGALAAAIAA